MSSPEAIAVDYGQRHRREIIAADLVAATLGIRLLVVDLSCLAALLPGSSQTDLGVNVPHGHYAADSMKATVVPNRNMILLSIAAARAIATGADSVAYAAHGGDHAIYPDCRRPFTAAFEQTVNSGNWTSSEFRVHAPFLEISKAEIVALGAKIDAPMAITWSCYEGSDLHCGRCGTCVERREAFQLAGVPDLTRYSA